MKGFNSFVLDSMDKLLTRWGYEAVEPLQFFCFRFILEVTARGLWALIKYAKLQFFCFRFLILSETPFQSTTLVEYCFNSSVLDSTQNPHPQPHAFGGGRASILLF